VYLRGKFETIHPCGCNIEMPQPWQELSFKNRHPRDAKIEFDEPTHVYTVNGSSKGVVSCTKFLHEFFPHFDADAIIAKMMASPKWPQNKYFGMTAEAIKKLWDDNGAAASGAGTAMHLAIEQFLHGHPEMIEPSILSTPEWKYFQQFWSEVSDDLVPYRSEWEVWSEEHKLAGSIDMIFYRKSDDSYVIYDWKRSKEIKKENSFGNGFGPVSHLPDANYWHYTLQLNVYRWFLETFYGLRISDMYIVIFHPGNNTYKRFRLNRLEEEVQGMLEARLRAVRQGRAQVVVI
jgi:ATP-dependent exoDNAse (exonuclease V) beta subunit